MRDHWSIENSWHSPRDTQLKEDAHRYREVNGIRIMATLGSLAMNVLRLDGFWSISEGLAALTHDIRGLLGLARLARTPSGTGSWVTSDEPWLPRPDHSAPCLGLPRLAPLPAA